MSGEIGKIFRQILRDIKVELSDEFDRNFERQAFFSEAWKRRRASAHNRATLIDTGSLRKSIMSRSDATSITFYSSLPYAAIHNEGGEIKVTARMKRYFWAKYYETSGSFGRSRGSTPQKGNARLTDEAEMWRYMALMKEGSTIKIPCRHFLGASPEVETAVRTIIEDNLREYVEHDVINNIKRGIKR